MTYSSLATRVVPSHGKYSLRNGASIYRSIDHHWAGTSGGDTRLMDPNELASANYILYSNGELVSQVPEEYRAWTSGSAAADNPSITIEIQNSGGPDEWPISDAALNKLIELTADIARRYGWGNVLPSNVRGHYEFYATACPGPYVKARLANIASAANAMLHGSVVVPQPPASSGKTIAQLADEVIAGLHGTGADRAASLGSLYNAVQEEVNRRLGAIVPPTEPVPVDINKLADGVLAGKYGNGEERRVNLGANYAAVQAEVDRRLGAAPSVSKGIAELADEVLAGVHGNGDARVASLGANYDAVQAEVNRRLGGGSGKSVSQLADEVLAGAHGNGDARRASLGASYDAVQAEVNRRFGL